MGRALAVPAIVWFLHQQHGSPHYANTIIASIIFFIAGFTDFFDGALARHWNVISRFGKLVDPLADKLIVLSSMIMVAGLGWLESWVVVLILAREFSVSTLRGLAAVEGLVMPAGQGGKIKTIIQMMGVNMIMLQVSVFDFPFALVGKWFVYVGAAIAWISGIQYFVAYFQGNTLDDHAA